MKIKKVVSEVCVVDENASVEVYQNKRVQINFRKYNAFLLFNHLVAINRSCNGIKVGCKEISTNTLKKILKQLNGTPEKTILIYKKTGKINKSKAPKFLVESGNYYISTSMRAYPKNDFMLEEIEKNYISFTKTKIIYAGNTVCHLTSQDLLKNMIEELVAVLKYINSKK